MAVKAKRQCGNCIFSDFHRTRTGRVSKNSVSLCNYDGPIVVPALPRAWSVKIERGRYVIAEDGVDCHFFKPR
jgi:hypothetical protein